MRLLLCALILTVACTLSASQQLQWQPTDASPSRRYQDPPGEYVSATLMARHLVELRWGQVSSPDQLLCAHPKRKGWVPKVALGTQSPTIRLKTSDSGIFVDEKVPVYVGCQVFISEKWKFIFIRQPKSSSTAVLEAIKTQLCGLSSFDDECEHDEFRIIQNYDDIQDLERKWKDYFVFTFVRNPWTRMLSAWKMFNTNFLFKRGGYDGNQVGDHCSLPFEVFAKNSNIMRDLCPQQDCCTRIVPLDIWKPEFLDEHITDQSHCVFLPGGESMVDFIGASESIDEDWPAVVKEINRRAGTFFEVHEVTNPNGHGLSNTGGVENSCELDSVRGMFNETSLFDLAQQYAMDVVHFGYMI